MKILNEYLLYLMLNEREWDTDTENPDSFDIKNFADVFGQKTGNVIFKKMRHNLQPSMFNIYIKNTLGDYMGRPDVMNSQTIRHIGFDQFQKDLNLLKKRVVFAKKIKEKTPKNFFKGSSQYGENSDPGDDGDGGDSDGGDVL